MVLVGLLVLLFSRDDSGKAFSSMDCEMFEDSFPCWEIVSFECEQLKKLVGLQRDVRVEVLSSNFDVIMQCTYFNDDTFDGFIDNEKKKKKKKKKKRAEN